MAQNKNREKTLRVVLEITLTILLATAAVGMDAKTVSARAARPGLKTIPLEISGWVPYWRTASGTADAIAHMDAFQEISPFGYTVKNDGTLFDAMKIEESPWQALIQAAHEKKVQVIPTIMWSKADSIHAVLGNPKLRKAHIGQIVNVISEHGFDGIDIDYEGKKAKTKKYFSLFLRDLYKATGKKLVVCSIEARTPLDSRFDKIPQDIQYANDFAAMNRYCDRVRVMTYDQGSIDLRLNEATPGPYAPVADPRWVEKVIKLASKTIAKKKIVMGVATYGYEFETVPTSRGYQYDLHGAFNPKYAWDLAQQLAITPQRNVAGELSFTYVPTTTPVVSLPGDTMQSNTIPLATTTAATSTATSASTALNNPFRLLWWSDASAIRDKISLAKKLGVRGIAIFKIDGGEDSAVWDVLK